VIGADVCPVLIIGRCNGYIDFMMSFDFLSNALKFAIAVSISSLSNTNTHTHIYTMVVCLTTIVWFGKSLTNNLTVCRSLSFLFSASWSNTRAACLNTLDTGTLSTLGLCQ